MLILLFINIYTYVHNHLCFIPIQISTHKWSFAYLKLLHILAICHLYNSACYQNFICNKPKNVDTSNDLLKNYPCFYNFICFCDF